MPIPNPRKIGEWSEAELAQFIRNTLLSDSSSLPRALALDSMSLSEGLEVDGDVLVSGLVKGAGGVASTVGPRFPVNPTDGQIHLLRVDVAPYVHVTMMFDGVLGRWVSTEIWQGAQVGPSFTLASAHPAPAGLEDVSRLHVLNGKLLWDAGLRPQARIATTLENATPGNNAAASVGMYNYSSADTGVGSLLQDVGLVTKTGTGGQFRISGWSEFSTAPTKDHLEFVMQGGPVSSGTCTYTNTWFQLRWVADG